MIEILGSLSAHTHVKIFSSNMQGLTARPPFCPLHTPNRTNNVFMHVCRQSGAAAVIQGVYLQNNAKKRHVPKFVQVELSEYTVKVHISI